MIGKIVYYCPDKSDKEAYSYGEELAALVVGEDESGLNLSVYRNGPGHNMFRGSIANGKQVLTSETTSKSRWYATSQMVSRARKKDGTYIADDPSTPDVNEAYTTKRVKKKSKK